MTPVKSMGQPLVLLEDAVWYVCDKHVQYKNIWSLSGWIIRRNLQDLHQYLQRSLQGKSSSISQGILQGKDSSSIATRLLSTNYSSGAISGSLTSASLELSTFSGSSSAAGRRTCSKASSEVLVISYSGFPTEFLLLVGSSSPEFSTSSPNISNYILHLCQETKVGVVLVLV